MIVMSGKEYFEEIIYRHLNRETSPKEEAELDAWLKESAGNQAEFDLVTKIWNDSSLLMSAVNFDKKAAWETLDNKIKGGQAGGGKIRPFYFRLLRVAAAVIFTGLLAGLVYYIARPKISSPVQVAALDRNQKIQMPDGSVIWLRKGSSLQYQADYPLNGRRVDLSGEAYFEVEHDEKKPFRIFAGKTIIEVLGTSFLVRSTHQEEQIFVTSGRVRISDSQDTTRTLILTSGQNVSVIGRQFDKENSTDINYLAWQSGVLQFDNVPLRKMIEDLNRNYQADISLSDTLAAKSDSINVNFRFENNTLDQVLDEIHLTTGWIVERNGNRIRLHEGKPVQ
jgi:transmembrane sensor